jgi:hypothetical protein
MGKTPIPRIGKEFFWLPTPDFHIPTGYQGRSPWLVSLTRISPKIPTPFSPFTIILH